MSKKKGSNASGGLMSSAGLTTYYDSEKENFAFDPRSILLFGVIVSITMTLINVLAV